MNATPLAITGISAVSSAGVGIEPFRDALRTGRRCLQPLPAGLLDEATVEWAPAAAFRVADFMPPLKARKFDRCSQFAIAAAGMALRDAGIDPASVDPARVGIILGCGFGGITNSEEFLRGYFSGGAEGLAPMLFPNTVPNAPASNASIEHRLKGPNVTFVQRFCSAESAFLMARRLLEEERADIILTGGADDLSPTMLKGFRALGQLRGSGYGRGFGEGSGMLVLEREEHARRRGARVRARLGRINTVGRLLPSREEEGLRRLLAGVPDPSLVSFSGVAAGDRRLAGLFPGAGRLDIGALLGRSLAMGGFALTALVLSLPAGATGLSLTASPEGPWYACAVEGVSPDDH